MQKLYFNSVVFFACLSLTIVITAQKHGAYDMWEHFKLRFGKHYSSLADEAQRRRNWQATVDFIEKHNNLYADGLVSYTVSENEYADMDDDEFSKTMRTQQADAKFSEIRQNAVPFSAVNKARPDSVDYLAMGGVTEAGKQGKCGCCFAYAAIGALETHCFLKTKKPVHLSVQETVDCSRPEGNNGCGGGWAPKVYEYILRNKRVGKVDSYPFEEKDGECRALKTTESFGAKIQKYVITTLGNEDEIQDVVGNIGPVTVYINSTLPGFKNYGKWTGPEDVFDEPDCQYDTDHEMAIVGYGTTPGGKPYYLLKNSWGTSWGENGFMRLARGKNACILATKGSVHPVVDECGADASGAVQIRALFLMVVALCLLAQFSPLE